MGVFRCVAPGRSGLLSETQVENIRGTFSFRLHGNEEESLNGIFDKSVLSEGMERVIFLRTTSSGGGAIDSVAWCLTPSLDIANVMLLCFSALGK